MPGHEREEGDRGDDQAAVAIPPDRPPAARRRKRTPVRNRSRPGAPRAEVRDDLDDAAADRDVAHQLRRPGVDLVVALLGEPLAILLRVGRQAGRRHVVSCSGIGRSMPESPSVRPVGPARPGAARSAGAAASAAARSPSGQSLNSSVSQRPIGPGRRRVRLVARPASWSARPAARGQRVDVLAVRPPGRRRAARRPTTRTRRPNAEPADVPWIAIGTSGTPLAQGEVRGALAQRPELATRTAGSGPPPRSRRPRRPRSRHGPGGSPRSGRSCPAGTGSSRPSTSSAGSGRRPTCPPPSARRTSAAGASAGSP